MKTNKSAHALDGVSSIRAQINGVDEVRHNGGKIIIIVTDGRDITMDRVRSHLNDARAVDSFEIDPE